LQEFLEDDTFGAWLYAAFGLLGLHLQHFIFFTKYLKDQKAWLLFLAWFPS
jgi:hypothetical protein